MTKFFDENRIANMASDQDKRKLSDLRVVDIRSELDKRGIDKSGVKAVILDRLTKALEDEGHDIESYIFDPLSKSTPKGKSATKGRTGSEHDSESEPRSGPSDDADADEDAVAGSCEDPEDSDPPKPAEEAPTSGEPTETKPQDESPADKKPTIPTPNDTPAAEPVAQPAEPVLVETTPVDKKPIIETSSVEETRTASSAEKPAEKVDQVAMETDAVVVEQVTPREIKKETIEVAEEEEARPVVEKVAELRGGAHDVNGADNEDSINLDIGEDEEKLLADEDDSCGPEKESKDEGERTSKSKEGKEASSKDEDRKHLTAEEKASKTQDDQKDDKAKSGSQEQKSKDDKDKGGKRGGVTGSSRNLWVSGLSSATRATDLKQVFSKHGKVIGAKVVTNARTPGARCYGYVTMATSEEASKCIQYLHRTELHGRMISVERAKGDAGPKGEGKAPPPDKKRHEHKANGHAEPAVAAAPAKPDEKVEDKAMAVATAEKEKAADDKRKEKQRKESNVAKPRSPHRPVRQPVKAPSPAPRGKARPIAALLTFPQIREERERQRLRERERELREEERRRREVVARQREVERKQRDEAIRLEREKEKLRAERERIEVERAQLLRMERERQRLERERLEREREELKRQQLRLEAARRPIKPVVVKERRDYEVPRHAGIAAPVAPGRFEAPRRAVKRPAVDERRGEPTYDDRAKRLAGGDRRLEPPPPARFEEPSRSSFASKKEVRRPEFSPPLRREPAKFERPFVPADVRVARPSHDVPSRGREQVSPGNRIKDARFDRGGGGGGGGGGGSGYRPREERRPEPDHRAKGDMRTSSRDRYPDSKPGFSSSSKGESRYTDRGGSTWHAGSGPATSKPFMSSLPPTHRASPWERKEPPGPWARPAESSWSTLASSYSSGGLPPGMSGLSSGGPYGGGGRDGFDSYKPSLGPVRKY